MGEPSIKTKNTAILPDAPLVTFLMPCYNSAEFMARGIESLLEVTESVDYACEVILVNDGSADDTGAIAHSFADKYPYVVAVDQENANWGGVVNHGLAIAHGIYFKIIDSDDRFDPGALRRVLDTLALSVEAENEPDLLITNYVYDRTKDNSKHTIQYRKLLPAGRIFTWPEMGKPGIDQFIMVHASWYKTEILRKSGLELPTGVSYMDSLFVLHPMPYVEKLFYLDVDAYHYLIGREGQSVEIEVVKKQIDQQLMATRLAIGDADYDALYAQEPNRAMLMMGYVSCMMSVSTIYLFKINTPESLAKNRELWNYLAETSPILFKNVKKSWAGRANRKTRLGRFLALGGYAFAQKVFKFA